MAKKINYFGYVKVNGVFVDEALTNLCFLRDSSKDSLRLSSQTFTVNNNVTNQPLTIPIKTDAVFTYFCLTDLSVSSPVSIKINGGTAAFSLAPDFWTEEEIESLTITNSGTQKYSITVVQLFAEGVTLGG